MKTLSVRQPWAYLICSGLKDVENRSWKTSTRGKVLIHAPKKHELGYSCLNGKQEAFCLENNLDPIRFEKAYHLSAIIGSVEIVDCVQNYESIWAEPGQLHWILKNPVLFDKPILNVPGKLGLWNYEGDL